MVEERQWSQDPLASGGTHWRRMQSQEYDSTEIFCLKMKLPSLCVLDGHACVVRGYTSWCFSKVSLVGFWKPGSIFYEILTSFLQQNTSL